MENLIPSKEKEEWRQLLLGELDVDLSNFVLQMKVTQANKDIKSGKIELEDAIESIHALCEKYAKAVRIDMEKIFQVKLNFQETTVES